MGRGGVGRALRRVDLQASRRWHPAVVVLAPPPAAVVVAPPAAVVVATASRRWSSRHRRRRSWWRPTRRLVVTAAGDGDEGERDRPDRHSVPSFRFLMRYLPLGSVWSLPARRQSRRSGFSPDRGDTSGRSGTKRMSFADQPTRRRCHRASRRRRRHQPAGRAGPAVTGRPCLAGSTAVVSPLAGTRLSAPRRRKRRRSGPASPSRRRTGASRRTRAGRRP